LKLIISHYASARLKHNDWRCDLKVVIEFPPGTVIAIPSGVCQHGNTCIGKKETQYSFTQYSLGGNFHWVDHGFQTEEDFKAKWSAEEAKEEEI